MTDYTATGNPTQSSSGKSKPIRDEFTLIETAVNSKANIASPAFTGTPTAPTAATGTSTTQIATTAFVANTALTPVLPGQTGNAGAYLKTDGTNASWAYVFNETHGANVASAATVDLDSATGNFVDITGTTTITAITLADGAERVVKFNGALTLTHNASLILPGQASITTASGDFATFRGIGGGVTRCVSYNRVNGLSVTSSMPLLSTVTASTSSTIDVETTFNSTYDFYYIIATGIVTSNDAVDLMCRLKVGGAYDTGSNYHYHTTHIRSNANTYSGTASTTGTAILVAQSVGTGTGEVTSFIMRVYNPAGAYAKIIDWNGSSYDSTPGARSANGIGLNTSTSALTGVRFYASAGTVDAGSFRLYGVRK